MRRRIVLVLVVVLSAAAALVAWRAISRTAPAASHSPYVDQLASPIRGLTAQEVGDLLEGRGAGFARTAELNGYPGPRHALDLAGELALTAAQRETAQGIFDRMNFAARELGREIVERERALSAAFAERRVTPEDLRAQAETLGTLYGELRAVHLAAHVELTAGLSAEQIRRYDELRGYRHGAEHEARNAEHQH